MIITIGATRILVNSIISYTRIPAGEDVYKIEFTLRDRNTVRTNSMSLEEIDRLLDKIDSGINMNRNVRL